MKINCYSLKNNEATVYDEDIDFSSYEFNPYHVRNVPSCHVTATVSDAGEMLVVNLKIKAKVICACAYTLEDVELNIDVSDEIYFSNSEEDSESCFYEPSAIIDLDPYILGIIFSEVPTKVIKPGAKLPSGGEGYRILSEDEFNKEQEAKKDPRWSSLDDIEFDED